MLGMGKSDPYCLVTVGDKTFRTKTIDNSLNPKWDFWCEVCLDKILIFFCYVACTTFVLPTLIEV